jgi:hypothetical protein
VAPSLGKDHLDDLFEAHLASCEQRSAQKMLADFEKAGIDEDLEHLKAGWAPSFSHRSSLSHVQPRQRKSQASRASSDIRAIGNGTSAIDPDEAYAPVSKLSIQGDMARDRLNQLEALRCIAGSGSEVHSATRKASFLPLHRRGEKLQEYPADSWEAWESRWSHEFQQFAEFQHAKRTRDAARDDASNKRREAQWREKVEQAKMQAEEAARRRREAKPHTKQTGGSKGMPEANSQKSPNPPSAGQRGQNSKEQQSSHRDQQKKQDAPKFGVPDPPRGTMPTPRTVYDPSLSSFADYNAAWLVFDEKVSAKQQICYTDVPWPTRLPTISGIELVDGPAERKKKLRASLIRWHPDKWGRIFDLVHNNDIHLVMEQVKEVTRRIIEERRAHGE